MFNTTTHHHHGGSSKTVNVTEKRAPTDESVRLLSEMEAAVMARVKAAISVTDTRFECVVHFLNDNFNAQTLVWVEFSMNGHRMDVKTHFDQVPLIVEAVIEKLISEVARAIACEILKPILTSQVFR